MTESYVLLDENNIVINNIIFDSGSATQENIDKMKSIFNAERVLILGKANSLNNAEPVINYYGNASIGEEWDNVDTFRLPKPGENYILDIYNLTWIELPQ